MFIRDFLVDTPQCDKYNDLSDVRKLYVDMVDSIDIGCQERIKGSIPTNVDEGVARAVAFHYNGWTQDRLAGYGTWKRCINFFK